MLWGIVVLAIGCAAAAGTVALTRASSGSAAAPPRQAGRPSIESSPPASAAPSTSASPSASAAVSSSVQPNASSAAGPRLLFGIGAEADTARGTAIVRQAPVRMLTSWYNGPNDLSWMAGWRTGTVPEAYAKGYALHLVVWTGDPEVRLSTSYGPACGRTYPLSSRFTDDMRQLATIFAGSRGGPPLYVTLFTEFQTYPCADNAWNPDAATTNYYRALKDQYRSAYNMFHRYAPNARVSLGWGGWQANYDDSGIGGGRSLFGHFVDLMTMSEFQSFQAMDGAGNTADITAMLAVLGRYGPVMLAHYKPDNGSQTTFDADLRAILTEGFLTAATRAGLFAMSFMDNNNLAASAKTFTFVKGAVVRYGRGW